MCDVTFQEAHYLTSAATLEQLPPDTGNEVAFIGRSNSGKSSALNALTNSRIARVSKTPGRTQLINFFDIGHQRRLVDLPGYGYAKVPLAIKKKWQQHVNRYLQTRQCLAGLVMVMDIRHPLQTLDQQLIDWATHSAVPLHILLSKSDKLSQSERAQTIKSVQQQLAQCSNTISIQTFSAIKRQGLAILQAQINQWLIP